MTGGLRRLDGLHERGSYLASTKHVDGEKLTGAVCTL